MKFFEGFPTIFIIFVSIHVISGDKLTVSEINSFNNVEANENFVPTSEDVVRTWGAINSDSVKLSSPIHYVRNDSIGTIAFWNVTYRTPRIMDGIRLTSVNNSGFGDITAGGIGFNFAIFILVGHSNFFTFIVESFENYTSSLVTTTPSSIPDIIANEWGTVNQASQILFPRTGWTGIANPGFIFQENIRVDVQETIDGVRLTSRENSVESGFIIDGGIGFNYVIVRVISRENFLSCLVEAFRNGTFQTTTPVPDYYVQHWGTVHSRSQLISDNRHYYYPTTMIMADRRITEYTDRTIHAMRLYALNGTRGAFAFIDGGLGHNFVTFRFVGESIGRGFDFRLELYNSAASKSLSAVLVLLTCLLYNILK